jgi:hypothetical protein
MPQDPAITIKFRKANPIDPDKTWEDSDLCESPESFADWLTRVLFIDAADFSKVAGVTRSATAPEDSSTIWAKTSDPFGIGIYAGGQWVVIYQYPTNTPFLWDTSVKPVPTYISIIDPSQHASRGLLTPTSSNWKWVIFTPS